MPDTSVDSLSRVLCVSVSGIGNTILFTPFLRALRRHAPQVRLDLLVWSPSMAEPVTGSGWVDRIWTVPSRPSRWPAFFRSLRREHYDASVLAFPSNKASFHLLSYALGAKRRISHSYAGFHLKTLAFLETCTVPAVKGMHDADQNLRLLNVWGWPPERESRTLGFHIEAADRDFARAWLKDHQVTSPVRIGFHPGAGGALADWQGSAKRWPLDRFSELAKRLLQTADCAVLILGGPEEYALQDEMIRAVPIPHRLIPVRASLKRTAAIIEQCALAISNDSGLMHVAAALNVPTLGIFGPTNPERTAPLGPKCRYLYRPPSCAPCLTYPFDSTSSRIQCETGFHCLSSISVEEVYRMAVEMLGDVKADSCFDARPPSTILDSPSTNIS